jgi:response regulator RpfG family c-di-GMP phosphodiesterase
MPADATTAIRLPARPHTTAHRLGEKPGILLVDDEERILRSLRIMLGSDYRIRITTSGHEALALLQQERFHVLVSDQRMPAMLGVDLLRRAREISPNTMRLLLTGYSDMAAIIGSINDGEVFRYLSKPWEAQELRQTIRDAAEIALSIEHATHPADSLPRSSGDLILLLDDDLETAASLREAVQELFQDQYKIKWAANIDEALASLRHHQVAIVFSEVRLGGQDITPFLGKLKHHSPDVVTVVLTSLQDNGLLVGLINQGQVHRFLLKAARKLLLKRALQSAADRHCELNSIPGLRRRHTVEQAPARQETALARRLTEFFRNFRRREGSDRASAN